MANINEQINNTRAVAAAGRNPLVAQLASKRVYDEALKNLDQLDRRPKVNFPLVVNTDHIRLVTEAYPEFSINFTGKKNSVHSLAGGLRALELEYLMLQVPFGSPCFDIGGNFTTHLLKGRSYVHCCNPMLDVKDVARVATYHDCVHKYTSRVTGSAKPCAINASGEGHSKVTDLKPLPQFQFKAFERFNLEPKAVSCNDIFQECEYDFRYGDRRYAISLHSIYDIPFDDIGPALLRKNIDFMYTAFHFSEELLLGYETGEMNEIGAFFVRDGDYVNFMFGDESTLHYRHDFVNLRKIVTRTYFPASDSIVYIKEFMVKRVNTFYFRLAKVNTHMLHRSVAIYPDIEKKKSSYFALRSSPIFKDKATFSVWFPKAKGKVVLPVFKQVHFMSGKVTVEKILVDSHFVFTIYNHICTYDNKALTWRNVQSFVESIRSRVVVNGVSVKSEWDVPVEFLTDISFTLFMLVKAKKIEVEFLEKKFEFGKSLYERFITSLSDAFGGIGDSFRNALMATGWFSNLGDELVIRTPELFMSFHDYLTGVFEADAEVERANVESVLNATESLYKEISALCDKYTGLDFDVEKFREFCEKFEVSPNLITTVIEGIFSASCGITVAGGSSLCPEANAAMAISPLPVEQCEDLMDTSDDDESIVMMPKRCHSVGSAEEIRYAKIVHEDSQAIHMHTMPGPGYGLVKYFLRTNATLPKQWAEKGKAFLPQRGLSLRMNTHKIPDDIEGNISVSNLHFTKIVDLKLRQTITPVLYTGPIRVRQMNNYLDYLSASLGAVIGNLERIVLSDIQASGETLQSYGLYDCINERWSLMPNDKGHQWAVVLAQDGTTRIIMLTYNDDGSPVVDKDNWVRFAVSTDTKLYSTIRSLEVLSKEKVEEPTAEVILVDGVPGCGKTAEIIEKVDWKVDLVLTPGKEASAMIRRRANYKFRKPIATNDNVRTFDSFVMRRGSFSFNTLWIDEGLMVHTGLINFAINMSGCKKAYIYGDQKQIPFINRVTNFDYPSDLSRVIVDRVEKRHVTKRCPRDVTSFLNKVYNSAVTTTSGVIHSVSVHTLPGPALFRPELTRLEGKIVTFTQSDKFTLLKAGYPDVNTVHEIQGETYPVVSLVRVTVTPVQIINAKSPHVVVALTRHTESLKYYTIVPDCVVSIIQDLEGVDQSILSMFSCVSGAK